VAGCRLPSDRVYDGQDIWPLLAGKGRFRREKPFVWVYADNVTAIRDGRWKLHVANRDCQGRSKTRPLRRSKSGPSQER
jgi:arylsulfatase A